MKNAFESIEGIKKRTAIVFFIIDQSGSMSGKKIGSVNHAMGESIPEMCKLVEDNADAELCIAILSFSNGATWLTSQPVKIDEYHWNNISTAGSTDLGCALQELNSKLKKESGFMKSASESYAPAFILISDGQPTDSYKMKLKELQKNGWFRYGLKTAIAIGDDADKKMLAEFTGNEESVIEVHNAKDLAKVIKFVSIASSQIVTSASSSVQGITSGSGITPPVVSIPADLLSGYDEF